MPEGAASWKAISGNFVAIRVFPTHRAGGGGGGGVQRDRAGVRRGESDSVREPRRSGQRGGVFDELDARNDWRTRFRFLDSIRNLFLHRVWNSNAATAEFGRGNIGAAGGKGVGEVEEFDEGGNPVGTVEISFNPLTETTPPSQAPI